MQAKQINVKKRKLEDISASEEEKESYTLAKQGSKKIKQNSTLTEVKQELLPVSEKEEEKNNNMKRIIVWFRNDLRLHDNYCLDYAIKLKAAKKEVLPVYSFDPRFMTDRAEKYQTQKCGLIRARFI